MRAYVEDFNEARASSGFGNTLDLADAQCAQAMVVETLTETWGPVIGYKVGLTDKAVQKSFGIPHPVRAVLLRDMILPDGSAVPAKFGALPMWEADFIAVVKSPALSKARTLEEAAEHVSFFRTSIELPDLMLDPNLKMNAPALVAINVGTRLCVVGLPVKVERNAALLETLANMTVVLEQDGVELARGPASAMMDHPLNSAVGLAQALAEQGIELWAGDLLSLGSFLPLQTPRPGTTGTACYLGLPADPAVSETFR